MHDNVIELLKKVSITVNALKFLTPECLAKWHNANSADPDQEKSDQGLHCWQFHKVF